MANYNALRLVGQRIDQLWAAEQVTKASLPKRTIRRITVVLFLALCDRVCQMPVRDGCGRLPGRLSSEAARGLATGAAGWRERSRRVHSWGNPAVR
jgi:hypothetical protein